MRVRLGGKYWTFRFAPNMRDYGDMQDPGKAQGRLIRVGTWQGEQDTLDTIIHEVLHAALWDLDEEAVHDTANAISAALWRGGYRRPGT